MAPAAGVEGGVGLELDDEGRVDAAVLQGLAGSPSRREGDVPPWVAGACETQLAADALPQRDGQRR
ncbi:hypothetical protein, partial [Streptomyces albus]|uniref:hypothetical protein n=1 Tax=Streptomyces sp. NRRL F-5639 TaxID=1463867 RepID=UPI001F42C667